MAIDPQFKNIAIELSARATKSKTITNCAHPNQKKVKVIPLPLNGEQAYYYCPDCNAQWQEISEKVPEKANLE